MEIISEQDVINTYDGRQQEQCRLYYEYKKIKQQNPEFGYKRIAKLLGQPYAKTRWWHCGKHIPTPLQTVDWLKERGLLPLNEDNLKLPLISKILGATFGDGGIDINHNMIFLSSSELMALELFKKDLIELFGEKIEKNFDLRRGGINNTSYCVRNSNRNVIRLFKALGAPIGNKIKQNLFIPYWIKNSIETEDTFYSSLFGSESGIPSCRGGQANTLDIAIGGLPDFHENRLAFMKEIENYLNKKGIKTGKISVNKSKLGTNQHAYIYRLLISVEIENMICFLEKVKLNYCFYKTDKLKNTINIVLKTKAQTFRRGRIPSKLTILNE